MANETQFIDGLIAKAPNSGAPDYVKAKLSIRREELIGWLQSQDGDWINVEVKESKGGKWYAAVDTWKPDGGDRPRQERAAKPAPAGEFTDDDFPF